MDPEPTKEYVDKIQDNSATVQNIMLWRIYDVMLLLLREVNPEAAGKLAGMHEQGYFAGPLPAFREPEND